MPDHSFYEKNIHRFKDYEIKEFIKQNEDVDPEDWLNRGIISQDLYNEITYISTEEHYENLRNRDKNERLRKKYHGDYIYNLLIEGKIDFDTLFLREIFSPEGFTNLVGEFNMLLLFQNQKINKQNLVKNLKFNEEYIAELLGEIIVGSDENIDAPENLPDELPQGTYIFLLGVTGSGKTSILSGILTAAHERGILQSGDVMDQNGNFINRKGTLHMERLIQNIQVGTITGSTALRLINYLPVEFIDSNKKRHPICFVELSGELIKKCYGLNKSELEPKLVKLLFNDYPKMLFYVVDYSRHNGNFEVIQWPYLNWLNNLLKHHKVYKNCNTVGIAISKWDKSPNQDKSDAEKFIIDNYGSLDNNLTLMQEDFGFNKTLFRFSLGYFDNRNRLKFNPEYSNRLVDYLLENSPVFENSRKWLPWGRK